MDDSENPFGPFFQRYSREDDAVLAKEIEKASGDLALAKQAGHEPRQLKIASVLGNLLTIARQEETAAPLLDWALPLARKLDDKREEAGVLLNLATARQYLGERDLAQTLFQDALDLARDNNLNDLEHYIQHHRGRCYAEQGRITEARLCFGRALHLRKQAGEPRAASSQKALDELEKL